MTLFHLYMNYGRFVIMSFYCWLPMSCTWHIGIHSIGTKKIEIRRPMKGQYNRHHHQQHCCYLKGKFIFRCVYNWNAWLCVCVCVCMCLPSMATCNNIFGCVDQSLIISYLMSYRTIDGDKSGRVSNDNSCPINSDNNRAQCNHSLLNLSVPS